MLSLLIKSVLHVSRQHDDILKQFHNISKGSHAETQRSPLDNPITTCEYEMKVIRTEQVKIHCVQIGYMRGLDETNSSLN